MRRSFEGKRHQPAKSEEKRKRCDRKHRGFGFFCAFLLCAGLISGGAAVSGESGAQEAVNAEAPADDAVQPEVPAQPVEEAQQNTPAPEDTEGGGEAGQQQEETPDQQQEELYPEDDGNGEESVPSVSRPDAGSAESSAAPVGTTAEPLTVSVTTAMKYAFAGENALTFETQITGGTEPFETSCEIDRDGTPVWSSQEYQPEVTYMPEEAGGYELVLSVTDAAGQAASGRCAIPVAVRHEESPSDWEPALKEVRMTGRYAEDLLAIARTQLGYTESADNFIVTEEGARQGYTRYGQWQGDAYEPWDAAFAAFCLYYAGVRDVPADTKAEKWADELKRRGMYRDLTAENRPEEGDFLFTRDGEVTRIGLVEKTDDTGVTAIEGDVGGAVARVTYGWDDARLAGFGDPRTTLTDEAAGVTVTGIFPEGATLTVQLLAEDADGFTEAQDRIHAALSPLYDRYAVNLADVTETAVYVPSLTVNGEVVSPCKKVRVGVSACGGRFAGHGDVRVLTFSDEQTELLSAEEKDGGDGADAIVSASFRTDRLSEFALTAVAPDRLTMRRTAADGDAKVTVTYGTGAGVPESAELRVRQIRGDGDDADRAEYQKRQAEAAALLETEAGGENAASQPDTAASGSPGNAENADVSRQTDQNAENAAADQQADQNAENVAADQTEDSKEYAAYMEEVEAALASGRKVQMAKLFDITILDKEGNEVEPLTPVCANIEFVPKEVQEGTDLELYQFQTEGEKPQVMENVEVLTDDDNIVNGIEFETDGFSVYGIVGTETLTTKVITAEGETYTIEVTYGPDAEIPYGATLEAREILEGTEEYQKYINQAQEAANAKVSTEEVTEESNGEDAKPALKDDSAEKSGEIVTARFFDINIKVDDEVVEPKAPVQVNIKYDDAIKLGENEQLKAIHFASDGTDLITVEDVVESKDGVTEVSFTQDSFSVTGTVVQYLSTGWPSDDGDYVIIVKPYNSNNYYAIKNDGELTSVNYNGTTGKVTFPDLSAVSEVDDYEWTISNHGRGWKYVTNGSNYLNPNYESAITTTRDSINRNSNGAVYNYTYGNYGGTVYNYLLVDKNGLKIAGQGNSDSTNRAVVFLANDFQVDEVPEPGEDPTEVDLGAPSAGKVITDNEDGTYNLALSVTGKSQAQETHTTADVIVVLDLSSSMYDSNNNNQRRLSTAKQALYTLAETLTDNNTEDDPERVRLSLVTFHNTATTELGSTYDYDTFHDAVEGLTTTSNGNGTNWEAGLTTANGISTRDGSAVYVIFVSDGNPTFRNSRFDNSWTDYNLTYYNNYGIWGTGSESNSTTVSHCYQAARVIAKNIVDGGKNFYTVGVFGNVNRMNNLTAYAYSGSDSGTFPEGHYQTADNEANLKAAFANIVNDINKNFSYTDVEIDDGITALTATALVTGTVNNYEYKVTYVDDADNQTKTVNVTKNSDGTVSIPSVTYGVKQADGTIKTVTTEAVTVKGATYDGSAVKWELDKSDGTNYKLENGWTYEVSFDVWPTQRAYDIVADLANGVISYNDLSDDEKKSIDQATLTLKTNSEAKVSYRQITTINGVDGTPSELKDVEITNPPGVALTGSNLKIVKRWNDSLDPTQLLDLLTDNLNDAGTDVNYSVTLDVMQDKGTSAEEEVHTASYPEGFVFKPQVTISDGKVTAATWPEIDIAVAPGIMMTYEHAHAHGFDTATNADGTQKYSTVTYGDTTYWVIEKGHRYEISERDTDYHFEMESNVDHLMIVDGVLKNVIFNDAGTQITDISQNLADLTELTATNNLKGGINLYKYVEDSEGNRITPKDDVFTVKCSITDKDGNAYTRTSETVGDDESNGIVYRVYAPDSELNTLYSGKVDTGRNRTIKIGVLNSSEFTVQLKAGWYIRFINVPSNSQWSFEEINLPDGYTIDYEGTEIIDGISVPKTRGTTGIALANTANDCQFTNTMKGFETRILKIETGTGTKDSETGEYITEPVKLDGVKFIVKNNNDGDDNGKYLVVTSGEISWDESKDNATEFTTANGGIASLGNLPLGKYLLTEIATKAGYNLLTEDVEFEVTADGVTYRTSSVGQPIKAKKKTVEEGGVTVVYSMMEIPNSAGVSLPNTGGPGTLLYTLSGFALILASALMYGFRMRRRERRLN